MYNRIILIGRLTAEPESRTFPSGDTNTRFTLAVERPFANKGGEREVDFIDVVAWGKVGETLRHLTKGEPVCLEGRLQIRTYTTDSGERRKVAEVVCDRFTFLHMRQAQADGRPPMPETTAQPPKGQTARARPPAVAAKR
jgi:single-strand DNA-binding protein